jgi:membrane protease YdiL (CAAX protease family)
MLLIGRGRSTGGLRGWGLTGDRLAMRLLQALLAYACVWPVCYGLLVATVWLLKRLVPSFEVAEHESIALLIGPEASSAVRAITVTSALVMAAVQEEFFFRGLLQQWLRRVTGSAWGAIVLASCAFGLFHWPLFQTMPALTVFSALLGILYFKTGSLMLVILLHAVFNGKTLLWIALGAQA